MALKNVRKVTKALYEVVSLGKPEKATGKTKARGGRSVEDSPDKEYWSALVNRFMRIRK